MFICRGQYFIFDYDEFAQREQVTKVCSINILWLIYMYTLLDDFFHMANSPANFDILKFSLKQASWLVRMTPERAVRVRALAGDIVLCSWARHLTLTVPLSTQGYNNKLMKQAN